MNYLEVVTGKKIERSSKSALINISIELKPYPYLLKNGYTHQTQAITIFITDRLILSGLPDCDHSYEFQHLYTLINAHIKHQN